MKMLTRFGWSAGILMLLVVLTGAVFPAPDGAHSIRSDQIGRGDQWLAWSPAERDSYVDGYIAAYFRGSRDACAAADALFEADKSHHPGDEDHPSDVPSARCLARV